MKPQLTPTLDEFSQLADRGNVIPLFTEFIADGETPVSAFKKLGNPGYSFLFESTEKNDVSGRFSFVGVEPRVIIQSYGRQIRVVDRDTEKRFDTATDPLDEIRKLMARYRFVSHPELPRFAGGAVGFLGYEAINFFEPKVPVANHDDLHLPEVLFMITSSLLIFDQQLRSLRIVVNAFLEDGPTDEVYTRAAESAGAIMRQLARPAHLPFIPTAECEMSPARSNFRCEEFERAVQQAKEYICAGDIFQVVLSQRFESDFVGDPLDFYRCLRFINPSPYMFCLKAGDDFALVGSSPEMHVRLVGDVIEIRPIAGTRPRGATIPQDERNAAELKNVKAYFQAGAGIVADSDPRFEYEETINKARAMTKALAMAAHSTK